MHTETQPERQSFLKREDFEQLFLALHDLGYEVIGPTVDQGAIIYDRIETTAELPVGWTDVQEPAQYRLERRDDDAYFGYVVGPHSWKRFLFPAQLKLSEAQLTDEGWQFKSAVVESPKYAFLGVRACELAALSIQDRIFLAGPYVDPLYEQRRNDALIIAVHCTQAAPTCFCTSTESGPTCRSGFDLALTELESGFVLEAATVEGRQLLQRLTTEEASFEQLQGAQAARNRAASQIRRRLDTKDLPQLLMNNLEHPRWANVAERCLSCTNCTMVCPTCFCTSVHEVTDLAGDHVERHRQWDSCFNLDFSYMNGGRVRDSVRSRYRQWLTHKLATWHDQFGTSGCVGCGRCITWCPVGIDLTEEVEAIRKGAAL